MPVWGLSALAAGSIGASMSDSGQAEVTPRSVPALANESVGAGQSSLSLKTPPIPKKFGRSAEQYATKAAIAPGMNVEFGRKASLAVLRREENILPKAVMGNPAGTASVTVAVIIPAVKVPTPSNVANIGATGVADMLQVAPRKATTNMMATASAAMPKLSSDTNAARSKPTDNRLIYGTSANNAHKVYFPQIEPGAPARGHDLIEKSISSAEQDNRVLTKQGSYLFYENQPEQAGTGKVIEALKASGAGSDKEVVDAIVDAAKKAEARELTAPALQKVPLNFGDRALEGTLQKSDAPPTMANGGSNAD